ncbi:hypothetical protein ACFLTO_03955 [Chloroflexota bacterium]
MKKRTALVVVSGLMALSLVLASCGTAADEEVMPTEEEAIVLLEGEWITQTEEEELPTLTEEQQEIWVERGILTVSTIEEASRLVGFQAAMPTFIPEDFIPGGFAVNQLGFPPQLGGEWGDGRRVVQQQWVWLGDSKISFLVVQFQGTEENVKGEPSNVCDHSGKRQFYEADNDHEHPLLVLHWLDSGRVYSVGGFLGDPLTEEILYKIACSVPEDRK